ncbi:hypothetical protein QYF36_020789 [Acer negundo]|nr:hypothetical protein QYF36_020789 [Acer negundo]
MFVNRDPKPEVDPVDLETQNSLVNNSEGNRERRNPNLIIYTVNLSPLPSHNPAATDLDLTQRKIAQDEVCQAHDVDAFAGEKNFISASPWVTRKMPGQQKKAHLMEIQVNGGDVAKKVEYAYSFFEKQIPNDAVFQKDEMINIIGVTEDL